MLKIIILSILVIVLFTFIMWAFITAWRSGPIKYPPGWKYKESDNFFGF